MIDVSNSIEILKFVGRIFWTFWTWADDVRELAKSEKGVEEYNYTQDIRSEMFS